MKGVYGNKGLTSKTPLAKGNSLCRTCNADSLLCRNGNQHKPKVRSTAIPIFNSRKNLAEKNQKHKLDRVHPGECMYEVLLA